jgi:hypothetical protein
MAAAYQQGADLGSDGSAQKLADLRETLDFYSRNNVPAPEPCSP